MLRFKAPLIVAPLRIGCFINGLNCYYLYHLIAFNLPAHSKHPFHSKIVRHATPVKFKHKKNRLGGFFISNLINYTLRRRVPAKPNKPNPKIAKEVGSGTAKVSDALWFAET